MRLTFHSIAAIGMLLLTAACNDRLPGGAPVSSEIRSQAGSEDADFVLYSVSRSKLATYASWPETGDHDHLTWISASNGAKTQIIQPGDRLTLSVWDSNRDSLLTAPNQKVTKLQDLTVAANGSVFLPYVGDVSVIGLTPDLARVELQSALETVVPSAQLQLTLAEGHNNSVDLVSGVSKPGNYKLPDRNFSILGLLALGGGVSHNLNNPQVRLARAGTLYGISLDKLLENPRSDTLLRGGDRVYVKEDKRYFLSFGATSKEDLFVFTKDDISAMDAVSMIGGLNDSKADPGGLLILREYPSSAVKPGGPTKTRVVFSLNLDDTDGIFSARRFPVNSQDLLIATESPINDILTVSNIVGNFVGVFNATNNLVDNLND